MKQANGYMFNKRLLCEGLLKLTDNLSDRESKALVLCACKVIVEKMADFDFVEIQDKVSK